MLQFVVLAAVRHVVSVGGEQDEIVRLAHVDALDDLAAEHLARGRVFQLRLAQGLQKAVLVAVGHLLRGKDHIDEVFAQRAGEGFLEQRQVHLLLLLAHEAHRGVDPGDDLTV